MSLVERALQKLRDTAGTVPARPKGDTAHTAPATAPTAVLRDEPAAAPIKLNREALRELKLLPPANREREISNQYQQIKRALIASLTSEEAEITNPTVMIASALPGEGKTYVSINLALRLAAEKDYEVLLVDGDVLKPHISRIFKIDDRPGLMDLLMDRERPVSSVVIPTDVPGLSILPAGQQNDSTTELLASQRMLEVITMLQRPDRRRIVLFDSPPLLLATEASALVPAVGQVILVVRAEQTPRQAVLDALAAIGDQRPVSLILNQQYQRGRQGYYNYGYGQTAENA